MSDEEQIPSELLYTKEHEWVRVDGGKARIGITWHAQHELGDIVFLELPEAGRIISRGEAVAVVESVKSVSDIYAPVAGTIISRHENIDPAVVNADPYGDGWLFEIEIGAKEADGLLSSDEYRAYIG